MTCRELESMLSDLLDGTLGQPDHARCVHHTSRCLACAQLVAPMGAMLTPVSVEPPATLLSDVLDRTSRAKRAVRWSEAWRSLMLRPRFACEAAYVGVVVLCVACATLDDVPGKARGDRAGVVIHEICSEAGALVDRAASLLQNLQPEPKEKS